MMPISQEWSSPAIQFTILHELISLDDFPKAERAAGFQASDGPVLLVFMSVFNRATPTVVQATRKNMIVTTLPSSPSIKPKVAQIQLFSLSWTSPLFHLAVSHIKSQGMWLQLTISQQFLAIIINLSLPVWGGHYEMVNTHEGFNVSFNLRFSIKRWFFMRIIFDF